MQKTDQSCSGLPSMQVLCQSPARCCWVFFVTFVRIPSVQRAGAQPSISWQHSTALPAAPANSTCFWPNPFIFWKRQTDERSFLYYIYGPGQHKAEAILIAIREELKKKENFTCNFHSCFERLQNPLSASKGKPPSTQSMLVPVPLHPTLHLQQDCMCRAWLCCCGVRAAAPTATPGRQK